MYQYSYPNSLETFLSRYDAFGVGSHEAEFSLSQFVEMHSIGDYIFTPYYEF